MVVKGEGLRIGGEHVLDEQVAGAPIGIGLNQKK
jgi:hypothetical protein